MCLEWHAQVWIQARREWLQDEGSPACAERHPTLNVTRVTPDLLADLAALVCRLWIESPAAGGLCDALGGDSEAESRDIISLGDLLSRWLPLGDSGWMGPAGSSDGGEASVVLPVFLTKYWEKYPIHLRESRSFSGKLFQTACS